jgi:hypothetical protein
MTDAERIEKLERQVALLKHALDHTIVLARHGSQFGYRLTGTPEDVSLREIQRVHAEWSQIG